MILIKSYNIVQYCTTIQLILLFNYWMIDGTIHNADPQLPFEAAFQGECRKSSPCHQLCFDLHDGTFECACHESYQLDLNGYSCLKSNHSTVPFVDADTFRISSTISTTSTSRPIDPIDTINNDDEIKLKNHHHHGTMSNSNNGINNDGNIDINSIGPERNQFYSCNEVECEAGGVCIEEGNDGKDIHDYNERNDEIKRARCRCPLGRGGQFCQKIIEVKYPHFRGTSYSALPTLRNAHRSLRLMIEFKSQSFDGVLLYSGQEPDLGGDFIAIVLNQGFVEFRFDCGMGEGIIRSDMPIILNAWNTLNIYRDGRNAWMQLNQGQQIFGHSKGLFSRITFRLETFLGGSPNISQIVQRVHTNRGFHGCVRTLQINERNYDFSRDTIDGIDIDQCTSDACYHTTCLNGGHCALSDDNQKICICPLGFTGEYCEMQTEFLIPSFNGSSHLQFIGFGDRSTMFTEIILVIKPNKPDGLFLYNGQKMDRTGDFISLNLVNGFVEFRFDLGSGAAVIRSPSPILLHNWHTIYAARTGREGILKVDYQPYSMGMSLGAFTQLSLPLNLYIGGVPNLRDIHQNVQSPEMFGGCIQKVIINGRQLSLVRDVLSGLNIENCQHICTGNERPCRNSGICEPVKSHYQCHCVNNYIGAHCEQGTGSSTLYPMFYGNSFLKYSDSELIEKISGYKTIIHLNLRAFSSNGLILWLGDVSRQQQSKKHDYLAIGLDQGHLNININLGSGDYHLTFNVTRIDDGQWHELDLVRTAKQIFVRIDHNVAVRGMINGDKSRLDVMNSLYLGGLEDTSIQSSHLYQKGFIGCISNMTLDDNYYVDIVQQSERGINIRTCI